MAGVHDLEAGNLLKGAIELRKTVDKELPVAMAGCSGMDEDMAALKSWEDSYSNIGTLTKVATKNWLLHKRKIENDLDAEKSDWDSGNYFNAGKDTADALTTLLPIQWNSNQTKTKANDLFVWRDKIFLTNFRNQCQKDDQWKLLAILEIKPWFRKVGNTNWLD